MDSLCSLCTYLAFYLPLMDILEILVDKSDVSNM